MGRFGPVVELALVESVTNGTTLSSSLNYLMPWFLLYKCTVLSPISKLTLSSCTPLSFKNVPMDCLLQPSCCLWVMVPHLSTLQWYIQKLNLENSTICFSLLNTAHNSNLLYITTLSDALPYLLFLKPLTSGQYQECSTASLHCTICYYT